MRENFRKWGWRLYGVAAEFAPAVDRWRSAVPFRNTASPPLASLGYSGVGLLSCTALRGYEPHVTLVHLSDEITEYGKSAGNASRKYEGREASPESSRPASNASCFSPIVPQRFAARLRDLMDRMYEAIQLPNRQVFKRRILLQGKSQISGHLKQTANLIVGVRSLRIWTKMERCIPERLPWLRLVNGTHRFALRLRDLFFTTPLAARTAAPADSPRASMES